MNEFTKDANIEFSDDTETTDLEFCPVCLVLLEECTCSSPNPDQPEWSAVVDYDEQFIRYSEPPF